MTTPLADAPTTENPLPLASPELEAAIAELEDLENQIATVEETLKDLRARRKQVGESEIVELVEDEMLDRGARFADGSEYTFEREYHCGVSKENKKAVREWLEEKNAGGMFKRYLILSFPKDSEEMVKRVRAMIAQVLPQFEIGLRVGKAPLTLVDSVREILTAADLAPLVKIEEETELPGPTLTAFVKKSVKSGIALPDSFGVYAPLRATKVKSAPKE